MKKIEVKNVIIAKQPENSDNFSKFLEIVKEQNINVITVNIGNKINIEKNVYFEVLWPDINNFITNKALNNNSIVCNLHYGNFSMLFTGDIEEEAEKEITKLYKNSPKSLNATVLKVAHHGSKTSSTNDFLKYTNSQIALIGVGEDNKFGHPNEDVLSSLKGFNMSIYRTDMNGEITIEVNSKGRFNVNEFIYAYNLLPCN